MESVSMCECKPRKSHQYHSLVHYQSFTHTKVYVNALRKRAKIESKFNFVLNLCLHAENWKSSQRTHSQHSKQVSLTKKFLPSQLQSSTEHTLIKCDAKASLLILALLPIQVALCLCQTLVFLSDKSRVYLLFDFFPQARN